MVYPFEQIFAADPSSPERVASNGSVLIFAPGDTTKTPLTINALSTGLPLPNPITVNNDGFGPAFTHDSLDQVAWEGGGFSGLLTSYKGMKDEAVAAREAADVARIAAEEAARNSAAPTQEAVVIALTTEGPAKDAVARSIEDKINPVATDVRTAEDAISVMAPRVDKVTLDTQTAADPLAYLNRIKHFATVPARPAGNLWPQSFSTNPEDGHLYVGYNGSLDGGATAVLRICVYTLAGVFVSERTATIEGGTSTEGLPWFRNALGQLCFIVRPATAGRGYAILNYETGALGDVIPLPGGNYKSAVAGEYFYTVDANDSTSGFERIFVYRWDSIQAGTPMLVETVVLDSRNRMEKAQSFAVNGSTAVFNHGASKSRIYLSAYNMAGSLATAFELDKADFAVAINRDAPGTIKNPESYRHESEGAWVHQGKTLTGHVIDDNNADYRFVIVAHNSINGMQVEPHPVPLVFDTDWVAPTLAPGIVPYSGESSAPQIRREGNRVYCDGAIKGLPGAPADTVVMSAPGFGPRRQLELPLQKSGSKSVAAWKVRPNGDILVSYSTLASPTAETWYPFCFTWVVN